MSERAPDPSSTSAPTLRRSALAYLAGTRLVLLSVERFVFPFLPALARGLDVSLSQAGLLLSARALGGLTVPLTIAGAGRRAGHKHRSLVAIALLLFAAGSLLIVVPATYAWALVGFIVLGAARPVFDVAAQAYVSDRSPYHRRARLLAVLELMFAGGLLVGAPIAGWLIAQWDWRAPFVVGAVLAALAATATRPALQRTRKAAVDAALALDREAVAFLGFAVLLVLGLELTFIVFGAWLEDTHGFGIVEIGLASIAIGVSELSGELVTLAYADRLGKRRTVVAGCVAAAASLVVFAVTETSLVVGFAAVAIGLFAFEVAIVAAIPLASELRPTARVRFLALFGVAMNGGRVVAAALGPWLYEQVGVSANAIGSAIVFVLGAIGLVRFVAEREGHDAG